MPSQAVRIHPEVGFNRPFATGREFGYIAEAIQNRHLSGNGPFAKRCAGWLERATGTERALLTHSCTGALEMSALLAELNPGDEVIMPSFTFVSTANAFVLRGVTPVFVDVREDTLNLDERLIEEAITPKTKAVIAVHYAGVGCEMDEIVDVARRRDLTVIEDAAQAILASYRGRPLGTMGDLATLSFHETKTLHCGEGGALLVNRSDLVARAEILQEKGTNRAQFFRGGIDKYTWIDVGSSFLLSEINAAFLWAQLEAAVDIIQARKAVWDRYHEAFEALEQAGRARRPVVPDHCEHNAQTYFLLLEDLQDRTRFISRSERAGVTAVFHYVPLHDAPAGRLNGRIHGNLSRTSTASDRLVRLPLWAGMAESDVERVIEVSQEALAASRSTLRRSA
jgi:dTDP-4-amino-4,6-dideoxygalactose transaminase